jgi:hypothetical protein
MGYEADMRKSNTQHITHVHKYEENKELTRSDHVSVRYDLERIADTLGMNPLIMARYSNSELITDIVQQIEYNNKHLESLRKFINVKWSEVFDSQRHFPADFHECKKLALEAGKKYMAFNGVVLLFIDDSAYIEVCRIEDLLGDRYQ